MFLKHNVNVIYQTELDTNFPPNLLTAMHAQFPGISYDKRL